jgi:hypothetical protein
MTKFKKKLSSGEVFLKGFQLLLQHTFDQHTLFTLLENHYHKQENHYLYEDYDKVYDKD